jgi:glycosyltransferase involved in cell wall biosynthesis
MMNSALAERVTPTASPLPRRLRIAVFSYGLPCPGVKRSGIEQVAHDLANALADRGHAVTVFTYDPRPSAARYDTQPLPWRALMTNRVGRALTMGYLGNVVAIGPRYRDFDVILAHGDSLLLPLRGKPVVRIMHGTALEEARSATSIGRAVLQSGVYVLELLTGFLQRGAVAVSANTVRFNPFIRRVIANGIDLTIFRPDRTARSRVPSILFVGALKGRKRGAWLLDLFEREIRPSFPDAELHMVTTPGPRRDGVTYHTGVETRALVRLYQDAWVYASPSTYEGFGLPYAEALACGTPIVATSNPGSREVLEDGRFGLLASDEEFGPALRRLLADAGERERLARTGLTRASEYDMARAAEQYEQVMTELIG